MDTGTMCVPVPGRPRGNLPTRRTLPKECSVLLDQSWYGPKPTQDEIHTTVAADGWQLGLRRYRPRGDTPHGEPVLLHHGLGSNAMMFDLGVGDRAAPTPSLAHWLADRGYDVWAGDLRGSGLSQRPSAEARRRWDWTVDDFIELDDPAFVDYILAHSSHKRLHWVGHSLGGILLFCHLIRQGDNARIASGITMASGLDYTAGASSYNLIVPLRRLGQLIRRVPAGLLSRTLAPLSGRINNPMESWGYWPPNTAPKAQRAILSGVSHDISGEVLFQLATLFQPGGLTSRDGSVRYIEGLGQVRTPTLMLRGQRDVQCSSAAMQDTYARLPAGAHKIAFFGREHGHAEDYGHMDLVAGLRADSEVFPQMHAWMAAHPI